MRQFETGATRDTDDGKPDFEGFFSPRVLRARAEYMHRHRVQADGNLRDSDNWQKGIPFQAYMKSGWRHFVEWWELHREALEGEADAGQMVEALCALMFNTEGYLHELLKLAPVGPILAEDVDEHRDDEQQQEQQHAAGFVELED